jgi:hypothetical protein
VAVDTDGTIYLADSGNNRVRRIINNFIYHFAGNSDGTTDGESGLNNPLGIAIKTLGEQFPLLYIADSNNHQIRVANEFDSYVYVNRDGRPTCREVSAGIEECSDLVEGASPSDATLFFPSDVVVDGEGNVFFLDTGNKAVRIVAPSVRVVPKPDRTPDDQVYTIARDIESFGISVEGRDAILVSDVTTNSILRLSRFLPTLPPTGQFDVHR